MAFEVGIEVWQGGEALEELHFHRFWRACDGGAKQAEIARALLQAAANRQDAHDSNARSVGQQPPQALEPERAQCLDVLVDDQRRVGKRGNGAVYARFTQEMQHRIR